MIVRAERMRIAHACRCWRLLHKASQAVKVTWKTDELDKENTDPHACIRCPNSPCHKLLCGLSLLVRLPSAHTQHALEHRLAPSLLHLQRHQRVRAGLKLPWRPAAMRQWAEGAIALVEGIAAERAGGQPASVRTVRLCGTAGLVAFSMIGECPPAWAGTSSWP